MNILVLDTETTGLTFESDDIVQIAWGIYDKSGNIKKKRNAYIETELEITNSHFHGITNEILEEKGIPLYDAMVALYNDIDKFKVKCIVCHNVKFDLNMIKSNCKRKYIDCSKLENINTFCTMKWGEEKYGKWLKLSVLHERLFKETPTNLHNALNDVKITAKCYFQLKKTFLKHIYSSDDEFEVE